MKQTVYTWRMPLRLDVRMAQIKMDSEDRRAAGGGRIPEPEYTTVELKWEWGSHRLIYAFDGIVSKDEVYQALQKMIDDALFAELDDALFAKIDKVLLTKIDRVSLQKALAR
ncbi:hypothetical protein MYX07_02520 [Patescibacteria group bacterium AH-259-L07]|nr:hypothetical protein [Patescibacteria group bacterium AH-259-L07]